MNLHALIPGGVKITDLWHHNTNDSTCSRCRTSITDHEVPLMLWANEGADMLIYCEVCMGWNGPVEVDEQ